MLLACAPAPGVPTSTADDGPVGDCGEVCWVWTEPAPPEAVCNAEGLLPDACPDGLSCGAGSVCEGDGGPYTLAIDLAPTALTGVPVEVVFSLRGAPWPDGVPDTAGQVVLTHRELGRSVRFPLPHTPDGRLPLDLRAGTWDVALVDEQLDPSVYPRVTRRAELVVGTGGTVAVDIAAWSVPVLMRVDGATVAEVPTGNQRFELTLTGARTPPLPRVVRTGQRITAPFVLVPDTYEVTLSSVRAGTTGIPGGVTTSRTLVVDADRDPGALIVELETVPLAGEVRVNGQPAIDAVGAVVVGDPAWNQRLEVRDGRYAGRVWPGEHAVTFDGRGGGVPDGPVDLGLRTLDGGELDLDLEVVSASGVLTVGGRTPEAGERGEVQQVVSSAGPVRLSVDTDGDAAFEGLVYDQPGPFYVDGTGALPQGHVRIGDGPALDLDGDLTAYSVSLSVDLGVPLPDIPPGALELVRVEDGVRAPDPAVPSALERASFTTAEGAPIAATGSVVPGTYDARYVSFAAGGSLGGTVDLGRVTIDGDFEAHWDVTLRRLTVAFADGGEPLQEVAEGHRGWVILGDRLVVVPGSGPSEATIDLLPGTYDVEWRCERGCGVGRASGVLWSGLDL
jgi:hypothetical protein